jgi:dTDP-4-dehydrorhamnose 3,5-epimerase
MTVGADRPPSAASMSSCWGRNQGLIVIPPGVYHGWKNIGADEATIVSMPSELYNHDGPDRWELPWDSDAARRIIPYQWP